MPAYTVTAPDGKTYDVNAPEGATQEDAIAYVQKNFYSEAPKPRLNAVEPPNFIERQLAKLPNLVGPKTENQLRGFAMGAADPSVGGAQLLANIVGQGEGVNKAIQTKEAQYEQDRAGVGRSGLDATRLLGNVASPANLAMAKLPVKNLGLLGQGAVLGGIGGALGGAVQQTGEAESAGTIGLAPLIGWIEDFISVISY